MPKSIKTRELAKDIKILDRTANMADYSKSAFIKSKDAAEQSQAAGHNSPTEYASDTITNNTKAVTASAVNKTTKQLKNPYKRAQDNFQKADTLFEKAKQQTPTARKNAAKQANITAEKLKSRADDMQARSKQAQKVAKNAKESLIEAKQHLRQTQNAGSEMIKTVKKNTVISGKRADKSIKTSVKTIKTANKNAVKAARVTVKTSKRSAVAAAKTAKATAKKAKLAAVAARKAAVAARTAALVARRATVWVAINLIRAVKASVKGLILLIAAGGKIAILVIVIISLIALLLGSVFGIFFSGEESPDSGMTVRQAIMQIDMEFNEHIGDIISSNPHDLLDISGARAAWRDVLAIYAVSTATSADNPMEVATMNDEKFELLKTIFWEMNSITHYIDTHEEEIDVLDDNGDPTGETETITIITLYIIVECKSVDEMTAEYGLTDEQTEMLEELLLPEYMSLWNSLLFGASSGVGSAAMVEIAASQIGNVGGEIYWRWYGFDNRPPWCAIFVSWVAEQCGLIQSGAIPKFASTGAGVQWFQDKGQWQPRGYTPAPGDLIFFDRIGEGNAGHVGIVEYVADGRVHTIEGNSSNMVTQRSYPLNGATILGYGIIH